jgi:transposase-like protein
MVQVTLRCPFCHTDRVTKYGICNDKQRYKCHNTECSRKTFYADYTYNACKPEVKKQIIKMSINGSGIRATARVLEISTDTVIARLKKRIFLE